MRDVRDQLQDYWDDIAADLPVPTPATALKRSSDERRAGSAPLRSPMRRPPVWIAAATAVAVVALFGASIWLLGSGADTTVADETPTVAEDPAVTATSLVPEGFVGGVWTREASYDGWLMDPVAFDGGYAAIRKLDPRREIFVDTEASGDPGRQAELLASGEASVGEVWLSPDGVEWERAPAQPPEAAWMLAGDGRTLFAQTGNLLSGEGTIWASTDGRGWRPVLVPGDYHRLLPLGPSWDGSGWDYIAGAVAGGPAGAVAFGADEDGSVAGWFYDGVRFASSDVDALALPPIQSMQGSWPGLEVLVFDDRFMLVFNAWDADYETTTTLAFSETGAVWSERKPPAANSPLTLLDVGVSHAASADGITLVSLHAGYGLWEIGDDLQWTEIRLPPTDNGWVPAVAAGEFGWIIFSPGYGYQLPNGSAGPDRTNLGLWFSPDAEDWVEVNDPGPLDGAVAEKLLVGDNGILAVVGVDSTQEMVPWGYPKEPVTEIWRLEVLGG